MAKQLTSKLTRFLKVSFSKDENRILLTHQKALRQLIGVLGMLLPLLLWLFLLFDNGHSQPLESISHYYFTRSSGIFTIIVSLLAIFLLVYRGKEPVDFYLSFAAGIFALCLLLFPTDNLTSFNCNIPCGDQGSGFHDSFAIAVVKNSVFRPRFHYISAAIFLSCLAAMSLFLFTKSDKTKTSRKKIRNGFYIFFGSVMVAAIAVIALRFANQDHWTRFNTFYNAHHLTFWLETAAVESFGISWLIKGEGVPMLRDRVPKAPK